MLSPIRNTCTMGIERDKNVVEHLSPAEPRGCFCLGKSLFTSFLQYILLRSRYFAEPVV